MNDILNSVLAEMPEIFSSHNFTKACRKRQIPNSSISTTVAPFLRLHAKQISAKTWEKNKVQVNGTPPPFKLTEKDCIEFLKDRGYKISKYVGEGNSRILKQL